MRIFLILIVIVPVYGNVLAEEHENQSVEFSKTDSAQTRENIDMNPDHVKFYHYYDKKKPTKKKEIIYGNKTSLFSSGILRNKNIKFLLHGFLSRSSMPPCETMIPVYLSRGFTNIICVEWRDLAGPHYFMLPREIFVPISFFFYPVMIKSGIVAGNRVSQFLQFLLVNKIVPNPSYFHILGHSLGAQVAGAAGYNFTKTTGKKIGRITGLDPAGPIYTDLPLKQRLDASDATFVDVVHTNIWEFGYGPPCGTVDFYANGGTSADQPICNKFSIWLEIIALLCSHRAAIDYYVRSILGEQFIACRCKEVKTEKTGICKQPSKCASLVRFGEHGSLSAKGNYYLSVKGNLSQSTFFNPLQKQSQQFKNKEANKMGMFGKIES